MVNVVSMFQSDLASAVARAAAAAIWVGVIFRWEGINGTQNAGVWVVL